MTLRFERWSLAPSVRYDRSFSVALARATAGEPLDVYDSRVKLWFVLVASVVVVLAAVSAYESGERVRGLYAIVFFFAGVWAARRLIAAGSPMIHFDREGVTINRSGTPLELPWSSLRSVYSRRRGGRTSVCLLPFDTAGALAATPLGPRILMRLNMLVFGAPFTLPAALSLGDDSLIRIVYAYAPWFADEQSKVSRGSRPTTGR